MGAGKSYRDVPMASTGAVRAAAAYVEREWDDDGYSIGLAGTDEGGARVVFQVKCTGDGSRFLVWADRWGNCGSYVGADEIAVADRLDVEVHGDAAYWAEVHA